MPFSKPVCNENNFAGRVFTTFNYSGVERYLVKEESLGFISMIDFRELVEKKVSSFPLEELEQAIKSVTKKHLAHITMLGGLLGFIIGLVQIVVNVYLL